MTADMCEYTVEDADIVINTSCEHITQAQYDQWLDMQPADALIILQSNNFFDCEEHIRCADDLENFKNQSHLKEILFSGSFETEKYDRYMIIGKKNV